MPTTNTNRKLLDLKRWEFCSPSPTASSAGVCCGMSRHVRQQALFLYSATSAAIYRPDEDGWVVTASPAMGTAVTSGAAITAGAFSTGTTVAAASLTATGGSTSTIVTNQTLARDLRGFSVHILAGPNAGVTLPIVSNTTGANATITVATQASAFSASTVYRLVTPTWYLLTGGTLASGSFRKYDFATNTFTTLANTGLPASLGTDLCLEATPSWIDSGYSAFATGTATAGGASTLTNSSKGWATNQWANYQIRITGGTGAGQIRTISSNTGTVITVSSAWTTQPDATSTYSIEGNDDFLYLIGNNAVAMYRYSITSNSWTTLSPTAARAAAPGAACSLDWVFGVPDSDWTAENSIRNGQRLYSFRGAGGAALDYYDIAANTWVNVTYSPAAETFTTGSKYTEVAGNIYVQKEATGRWFRYDVAKAEMDGWNTMLYPNSTAVIGDTCFEAVYIDGATQIPYVYMLLNTSTIMLRQMVI